MRRDGRLALASAILAGLIVFALMPLTSRDASALAQSLKGPGLLVSDAGWWYGLGTDALGRSVLREIMLGMQTSVQIASVVSLLSAALGIFVGVLAARPRWYAAWINRGIDIALAMPGLLIALVLTAMLGPATQNVILAFVILGWTGYAKVIRGEALRVRSLDYVAAATLAGASTWRIDRKHILPQTWHLVVVQLCFGFAAVMLGESTLSYLGLGDPTAPTLGKQISEGVDYMRSYAYLVIAPGAVLASLVLILNWIGDQLQRVRAY